MDSFDIINNIVTFCQANPLIAIVVGLLLVFLAYREPKFFFTVFFIAILLAGVFYLVTSISDVGVSHKKTITNKQVVPLR